MTELRPHPSRCGYVCPRCGAQVVTLSLHDDARCLMCSWTLPERPSGAETPHGYHKSAKPSHMGAKL